MGVSREEAEAHVTSQADEDEEPDAFEVLPENWDTVMLFMRMQTQWHVAGMGGLIGLKYTALESVMNMCKVKDQEQMFDRIRVMEAAALEAMDSHADQ